MKNSINRLVKLVAAKDNPHDLINKVAADAELLSLVRRLCQEKAFLAGAMKKDLSELCGINRVPIEFFYDRLGLVARILNLEGRRQDYYRILGIGRNATQQEIKHAFRQQSLANHPDTNPGEPQAVERFRNILDAYEILSNDNLRKHYDRSLEDSEWAEQVPEDLQEKPPAGMRKWPYLWPALALVGALLLLVFLVDYQSLMTDKYYRSRAKVGSRQESATAAKLGTSFLQSPMPDITSYVSRTQIARGYPASTSNRTEDGGLIRNREPEVKKESQVLARLDTSPSKVADSAGFTPSPPERKVKEAPAEKSSNVSTQKPVGSDPKPEAKQAEATIVQKSTADPGSAPKQEEEVAAKSPAKIAEKPTPEAVVASLGEEIRNKQDEKKPAGSPAQNDGGNASNKRDAEHKGAVVVSSRQTDVVAANERPKESVQDLKKRVESFLRRYTQAYQQRDLMSFLGFFETDALENGEPVKNLTSAYLKTFSSTEQIRFQIQLQRCSQTGDGVSAKGRFHLMVRSESQGPVESNGLISLRLVDLGDDFKVKNLEYSFANREL